MAQKIYYVYDKATGEFAGSGTPFIDDDTHGCTTTAPNQAIDKTTKPEHKLKWNGENWVTEQITAQQL
jgi:hypothetical protein